MRESASIKKEGVPLNMMLFERHRTPRRELDYYIHIATVQGTSVRDAVRLKHVWFPQCTFGTDYLRIDVEGFN